MWNVILLLTALSGVISLRYKEGGFPAVLIIIISVASFVLLILLNKLPDMGKRLLGIVSTAACIAILINISPVSAGKTNLYSYSEAIAGIEELMLDDKDSKAEKELEKLEDKYGETDETLGLRAYMSMNKKKFDDAYSYMSRFSDKRSIEYYRRLEVIYLYDEFEGKSKKLYDLYLEAADIHENWAYIQRMAGVSCFEKKDYSKAAYYLSKAAAIEPSDYITLYYLGAVCCETGDYDSGEEFFLTSIEYGATEQYQSWMLWYMERGGKA